MTPKFVVDEITLYGPDYECAVARRMFELLEECVAITTADWKRMCYTGLWWFC